MILRRDREIACHDSDGDGSSGAGRQLPILALCPKCWRTHKIEAGSSSKCLCGESLYDPKAKGIAGAIAWGQTAVFGGAARQSPRLSIPIATLSSLLTEWLYVPGIEEAAEAWGSRSQSPNVLKDVMDGRIWQELKGESMMRPSFRLHFPMMNSVLACLLHWIGECDSSVVTTSKPC